MNAHWDLSVMVVAEKNRVFVFPGVEQGELEDDWGGCGGLRGHLSVRATDLERGRQTEELQTPGH